MATRLLTVVALLALFHLAGQFSLGQEGPAKQAHTLTWGEYDGGVNAEGAVLILDGEKLGRGKKGWENVKEKLSTMEEGSRLIVYPDFSERKPRSPLRMMPIELFRTEFEKIVKERALIVEYQASAPPRPKSSEKDRW